MKKLIFVVSQSEKEIVKRAQDMRREIVEMCNEQVDGRDFKDFYEVLIFVPTFFRVL